MTNIKSELKTVRDLLAKGRKPRKGRPYTRQDQLDALTLVASNAGLVHVPAALAALRRVPGAYMYRRELFREMERSVEEFLSGEHDSLADAATLVRNRTRHAGRAHPRCVMTTTLLAKGLEFDHAVLLDAEQLSHKDLYVAMTHGSRSLTVLSPTSRLPAQKAGA